MTALSLHAFSRRFRYTNETTPHDDAMKHLPVPVVAWFSLVVLASLTVALAQREQHRPSLIVHAAPATRIPLERIAEEYERETGLPIELRFAPSEELLTKLRLPYGIERADLFIPADDSYVKQTHELGLVAETFPVAQMQAVLLVNSRKREAITEWSALVAKHFRVGVPTSAAAVGKLSRDHLEATGNWNALQPYAVDCASVTDAANAVRVGSVDAAIVWDAVAYGAGYREHGVLHCPELAGVRARIEVAVLKQSANPDGALHFARYLRDPEKGLRHFHNAGFR